MPSTNTYLLLFDVESSASFPFFLLTPSKLLYACIILLRPTQTINIQKENRTIRKVKLIIPLMDRGKLATKAASQVISATNNFCFFCSGGRAKGRLDVGRIASASRRESNNNVHKLITAFTENGCFLTFYYARSPLSFVHHHTTQRYGTRTMLLLLANGITRDAWWMPFSMAVAK